MRNHNHVAASFLDGFEHSVGRARHTNHTRTLDVDEAHVVDGGDTLDELAAHVASLKLADVALNPGGQRARHADGRPRCGLVEVVA